MVPKCLADEGLKRRVHAKNKRKRADIDYHMAEAHSGKSRSVVEVSNEVEVDLFRENCKETCKDQGNYQFNDLAINLED